MLFVWVILIAAAGLSVLNAALTQSFAGMLQMAAWESVVRTLCAVTYAFVLDALLAVFIRRALPSKWFDHKKALFTVGRKEKNFYEKAGIRKWKDKIPEWGKFTDFSKNKIACPKDNEYLSRYFMELCYGEAIHFFSVLAGFTVICFVPRAMFFSLALPVALINAACNLPSLFILRYNSYKLEVLYKNNEKRAARAAGNRTGGICRTEEKASAEETVCLPSEAKAAETESK